MPPSAKPRRPRLSDKETEQRTLRAAMDLVHDTGLTVSLKHLSLEKVIREAGVARAAVYRRWPNKDEFFNDLLLELAKGVEPAELGEVFSRVPARELAAELAPLADTARGRWEIAVEIVRRSNDFDGARGSRAWRTYLALHATFLSLDDGPLRERVREALARSEEGFIRRIADSYRFFCGVLGIRIKPEAGLDFDDLATMASSAFRGVLLMAPTVPALAETVPDSDPLGAGRRRWRLEGLALAGMVGMCLEADPDVEWTEERVEQARAALAGDPGQA
ncbi:TetR/AcrR family transcriptional regulator [Salininema proteolyticum]|uniref:TetR/AcrR family transcriptional regulator n=1 Tax=Salininema proteolyticum TaxID=1607685 RepID=A0ABV8U561_9ACTN